MLFFFLWLFLSDINQLWALYGNRRKGWNTCDEGQAYPEGGNRYRLFFCIIGSVIPIIITIFGYTTLYDFFDGKLFNSSLATLVEPMPFIYNVSGVLLLIGIIVGMIGSYQAVRKYLKI